MTDALAGLTRKQLEDLRTKIDLELRSCVIDGREGAEPYRITKKGTKASIMLCVPCFEKFRLPELRSQEVD
jgi:hypothetical protein